MAQNSQNYTLGYDQPAKVWEEALPIGNGRLGGMVFGRIAHEHLQLNDITIWSGKPEAYKGLPEIRQALRESRYEDVQRLTKLTMTTHEKPGVDIYKSSYFASYQTLGDLDIDFDVDTSHVKNCKRWLDIEKTVAGVEFTTGRNKFTRELFSSAVDGIMVMRIKGENPGSVAFTAILSRKASARTVFESPNTLVLRGNTDYKDHKGNCEYEACISVKTKKARFRILAILWSCATPMKRLS